MTEAQGLSLVCNLQVCLSLDSLNHVIVGFKRFSHLVEFFLGVVPSRQDLTRGIEYPLAHLLPALTEPAPNLTKLN